MRILPLLHIAIFTGNSVTHSVIQEIFTGISFLSVKLLYKHVFSSVAHLVYKKNGIRTFFV